MADVTGVCREEFGGEVYRLRLTMLGLAALQDAHGPSIAGLLDGSAGKTPSFRALVDVVSQALQKGENMPKDQAVELADAMVTADTDVVVRVLAAAFPEASAGASGNGKGPKRAA